MAGAATPGSHRGASGTGWVGGSVGRSESIAAIGQYGIRQSARRSPPQRRDAEEIAFRVTRRSARAKNGFGRAFQALHSELPMDKALQTQLDNIQKKTGKSLDELSRIVTSSPLAKHGELVSMLKDKLGMGH